MERLDDALSALREQVQQLKIHLVIVCAIFLPARSYAQTMVVNGRIAYERDARRPRW